VDRSVCRVMVAVAGMAVLGMTATLAGAQTAMNPAWANSTRARKSSSKEAS
jgi:hypothetical protein